MHAAGDYSVSENGSPPDVGTLMWELDKWAVSLDSASTRLGRAMKEYEGDWDAEEWQPGPKLRYEEKIAEEADKIYADYEGRDKRPPSETIREFRAEKILKAWDFQLWADYHRLRAEIEGLQKWMSSKKESISARQSVLSAEKALIQ